MKIFIPTIIALIIVIFVGCDECNNSDDPPPTFIDRSLSFLLLTEDDTIPLVRISDSDSDGLYDYRDIEFLNEAGISVKDSLFSFSQRNITFRSNRELVNNNLIQNFQIIFSQDYSLPVTIEHVEIESCNTIDIRGINIIIDEKTYPLGIGTVIYI